MKKKPPQSIEDKKLNLILRAIDVVTEQESRGSLLKNFKPKVEIVISREDDEDYMQTDIRLEYDQGMKENIGHASNWGGMGRTLDEALTSNLWCLRYEIEDRMAKFNALLPELKELAPIERDEKPTTPEDA